MLINLYLKIWLIAHLLCKEVAYHAVRAAAVIGKVYGVQVRMIGDKLCT